MNKYEVLTKEEIEEIHEASLEVFENTGIKFRHQYVRDLFSWAGAKVEGEKVYIPRQLVEEQLKKVPGQFTLYARDPEYNVTVGRDNMTFIPGFGAAYINEIDNTRRAGTMEDFDNFAKLTAASPYQNLTGGVLIDPSDVPDERKHIDMAYSCIKNSNKCFMGSSYGAKNAQEVINMTSILYGTEWNMVKKPVLLTLINTLTPLIFDDKMLESLIEHSKIGQPVIIASHAVAGFTSPVTLAGTLVIQNCEILSGIVLTQLIREGTPAVYGAASSIADMGSASLSAGSPEVALIANASTQISKYYGLPCKGASSVCDAKIPDAQSGYESMMNLLMVPTSGSNIVLHAAGILEGYNVMSYEKFIIDDEMCGMMKRMQKGIEVNKDTLATDVINQVGSGGHFMDKQHTFINFRKEFLTPKISNRGSFDTWRNKGALQVMEAANKKYKEILKNFEPPDMPADVEKDIKNYIEKLYS